MPDTITVLIVEDEDTTMRSLLIALKHGGFDVLTTQSGADALKTAKAKIESKAPLDFMLYDIHLPDMTGLDLIDELEKAGIALPSLAITGFASREITRALRERGGEVLEKPFEREQLYEKIRTILAAHGNS